MILYNTLTRKKEELETIKKGIVSMYVCGPTVYNTPTLGNLRTYLNTDFLRRSLKYLGYTVNEVMNITDIEDKIIRDSAKQGISYIELTQKYEKVFLENLKELNIETPEHMPRATKEIPGMIKIIEKLLADGYAYKTNDGSVYFDIKKFKNYGELSRLDKRELKSGTRIAKDEYDKENADDFALWKAEKPGEPSWDAPFGKGRPGWHIECTAMSTKYLGNTLDIHAGGVDLIFPHHENEIAQSESYTGKKFVTEWFHGEHLLINGDRMGKSLGNFYTLKDLEKKFRVGPLAFRMLALQSHYRDKLNFTDKSIQDAENALEHLQTFVLRLNIIDKPGTRSLAKKPINTFQNSFKQALSDDLAMPAALAALFALVKEINKISDLNKVEATAVLKAILESDKVLGLSLNQIKIEKIPTNIIELTKAHETARIAKDFDKSDELRAKIDSIGYSVEDTADGPIIRKK